MIDKINRLHFIIRIIGAIGAGVLVRLSPFQENLMLFHIGLIAYIVYSIVIYKKIGIFKNDNIQRLGFYFDVLIISISIAVRGGIRTDFYLGYFMILSYVIYVDKDFLLLKLNAMIIICYTITVYISSPVEEFSISRIIIRMMLLLGSSLILRYYSKILNETEQIKNHAINLANIDMLTGAYNRRAMSQLNEILGKNYIIGIIAIIDLDNFKIINDTYGHIVGDDVLRSLSNIIRTNIGENDVSIRYGGEEFLLIFKTDNLEVVESCLKRIQYKLSHSEIENLPDDVNVTFTAGISYNNSLDLISDSIKEADTNLYIGKKTGKNCIISTPREQFDI